jgi:hypothetical protein
MEAGHPMNRIFSINPLSRRRGWSLALAAVVGMCALAGSAVVSAQSTAGMVFGKAPVGYAISVRSTTTGAGRTVHVDSRGRYSIPSLPVGVYTVTLKQADQAIAKHLNVPVVVGRGSEVDFDCSKMNCGEVASK